MNNYSFPFLGAGNAVYYEWCEIYIKFINEPTPKQKKTIIDIAPSPIKPKLGDFDKMLMVTCSKQFVNMYIEEAYGMEAKQKSLSQIKELEEEQFDDNLYFFVSDEAAAAFEKDIETWLNEIHEICQIELAYRLEDEETEGTELSQWHEESCREVGKILEQWLSREKVFLENLDYNFVEFLLNAILVYGRDYISDDIKNEAIQRFLPRTYAEQLLSTNQLDLLMVLLENSKKNFRQINFVCEGIYLFYEKNKLTTVEEKNLAIHLFEVIIASDLYSEHMKWGVKMVSNILSYMLEYKKNNIVKALKQRVQKLRYYYQVLNMINYETYQHCIIEEKKWNLALNRYQFVLDIMDANSISKVVDYSIYCNILYILQNDVTGFPVDYQKNEKYIKICAMHAEKNPPIYFNIAILYIEMNEYDLALAYMKKYFATDDSNRISLIKEIQIEKIYEKFRSTPKVKFFLETLI